MLLWFTEDVGEDPPTWVFGGGNAGVDAEGVGKAPGAKVLAEAVLV